MLDILVPVLGRPHRVRPLLDSIRATTPVPYRVLFVADRRDANQQEAVRDAIAEGRSEADLLLLTGSYARKINAGVRRTENPYVFFGADDLVFHPQWFEMAVVHMNTGAQVVGVNDLCSRRVQDGQHATHFLVTRAYCGEPTIDGEPGPLCELYYHWFVDDELVETARHRGVLAFASNSVVEHQHPMNGTAPDDETYRLGRSRSRQDRRRFRQRRALWCSQ